MSLLDLLVTFCYVRLLLFANLLKIFPDIYVFT